MNGSKTIKHFLYTLGVLLVLGGCWWVVEVNGWQGHALEWLNLLVRWAHVIIGIAWIGASFYFIFLENSLNRTHNLRDELAGNLWAIHGGGFYYVEKYKVAPKTLPETLHWFKYEAYFTWITGFFLLIIVYYAQPSLYLIDPEGVPLAGWQAVAIGIGSLAVGWFIYDGLCKSPLVQKKAWFAWVTFGLVVVFAFGLHQVFSSRGAYIHTGAMLGTLMAFNVFRVIIPSQKALVRAAEKGEDLDATLGKKAGLRSLHNNYMTLPVVFIMISSHFPSTYGNAYAWAVLAGLFLASAGLRHYLNLHEQGRKANWILPLVTLAVLVLAYVTAPKPRPASSDADLVTPVPFSEVQAIFEVHCVSCHATNPTDEIWTVAPKGVVFETPTDIAKHVDLIQMMVVESQIMPLGNKTNITEAERAAIGRWIAQGANLP